MSNFNRYARQTMLSEIGEHGQSRLRCSSVLIVGAGGLGAVVATYLTGAGIGRIGIADPDTVSLHNLQRQVLYTEKEVGLPKTQRAAARLKEQNSEIIFDEIPEGLTVNNGHRLISNYDLVVDCCDNFATRFLIDDLCAELGKPWVHGSIGEFFGQVAVMNFKSGKRYSDLYSNREQLLAISPTVAGVIGAVPAVIGALQANEVIKIIAGFGEPLDGRLFCIDLKTLNTNIINF